MYTVRASPGQAYEVWRTWDNICTSYNKWLCVFWRIVASRESLRVCHSLQTLEKILLTFNPPMAEE